MPSKNIWKKLNLGPTTTSTPTPPSHGTPEQYHRVQTTWDVKRVYQSRAPIRSTASGVYVLSAGRHAISEPALVDHDPLPPSEPRDTSPTPSITDVRGQVPPSRSRSPTAGWSSDYLQSPDPASEHAHYQSTRANQWTKWTKVVIPSLVETYFRLMHRTEQLGIVDRGHVSPCTCMQAQARSLNVTCVYFDCEFLPLLLRCTRCLLQSFSSHSNVHPDMQVYLCSPSSPGPWPHGVGSHTPNTCRRHQTS